MNSKAGALIAIVALWLAGCDTTLAGDRDAGRDLETPPDSLGKADGRVDAVVPPGGWLVSGGGPGKDVGLAVLDGAGNVVVLGEFNGTATFGATTLTATAAGARALFVAKLDPTGTFLWAVPVEVALDTSTDYLIGLDTDGAGNIYVAAPFTGSGSFGGKPLASKGATDALVAKLSPTGQVQWAVGLGGTGNDEATALAVDAAGKVTVTGFFTGTVDFGGTSLTARGAHDIFVIRLTPAGTIVWAVQAGSDDPPSSINGNIESGSAVALDAAGNAIVGGTFRGTATFGGISLTTVAVYASAFVAKLDPLGSFLTVTEVQPTPTCTWIGGIALDTAGNAYLAGAAGAAAWFKLDPTGKLLWKGVSSGGGFNWANAIVLDGTGSATLAMNFGGTTKLGNFTLTAKGDRDVALVRLDSSGNPVAVVQAGGTGPDTPVSLARDASGSLYVSGCFSDKVDFDGTELTSRGKDDLFVWKRPGL